MDTLPVNELSAVNGHSLRFMYRRHLRNQSRRRPDLPCKPPVQGLPLVNARAVEFRVNAEGKSAFRNEVDETWIVSVELLVQRAATVRAGFASDSADASLHTEGRHCSR